ncbi:uncharacterized protein CTHT_0059430 [Thermochaetoides thermophila DSM 1495]|uniref:DUF7892 domain-containing protein n=1 Tax=Chaetomium thermophilum (strain DSM 1495 / CBS 144.50 / IMI 039719) TaxID=759272 RepID=G0SER4_CHATD|nr:hypothetical protein CTHT_0059430 [Thermochaetoides thermophila DSM 1495]EGS17930.1 hypothetical protein CTHT_0059430 [Thermochaetoides thermophila DSM 1495]
MPASVKPERVLKPNAIWQASRRLFWPQMPTPLRSKTELEMWRLAWAPGSRSPGPGRDGVAAIWAFGARFCGSCLLENTLEEQDLLVSSLTPVAILPALPFVLVTKDQHVFSSTTLKQASLPSDTKLRKLYLSSDYQALIEEFLQVKDMGQGTMGEWLKGLPDRGSDLRQESAKWEKWESSGGVVKMRSLLYPDYAKKLPAASAIRKPSLTETSSSTSARPNAEKLRDVGDGEGNAANTPGQQHLQGLELTMALSKEARDRIDKEWEEVQAPLRAKISGYTDKIIRELLAKEKVTKDNCSRFAVEVLLYVRKRFYTEVEKEHAAARAANKKLPVDPPDGPFTQKLTLENMKWIFDTKIRPLTDRFRKEIFYCNDCEGNCRAYGFEGVIQHYAAKHTTALSRGNAVVYWRAEWPKHPPFRAEPRPARQSAPSFPPVYKHGSGGYQLAAHTPAPASYPYPPAPAAPSQLPIYPPPTGYGYNPPVYGDYCQPPPPQPLPPSQQYHPVPVVPPVVPPPTYETTSSYPVPPAPYPPPRQVPIPSQLPVPNPEPAHGYAPSQPGHYERPYGSYSSNANSSHVPAQPPAFPDLYQLRLDDIARNSRELWRLLGAISNLPGNVKVYVTIHHTAKRFRSRFHENPPLSLFIDGLSNHKDMRPVRNVNGLICKACHLHLDNQLTVERDRKSFSLPQLANHFQIKHVAPMEQQPAHHSPPRLDWVEDMVFLGDIKDLSYLDLNEYEKELIAAALPFLLRSEALIKEETPNLLDALESRLVQRYPSHSQSYGRESNTGRFAEGSSTIGGRESVSGLTAHSPPPHVDHGSHTKSPIRDRRHDSPSHREPSSPGRPLGHVPHSVMEPFESNPNGAGRSRPAYPGSRHAEEDYFRYHARRPNDRGYDAFPPDAEYRRYPDESRTRSWAPIEAYEIVHVIDENGEYYIRRPVRREPDPRYAYEERRVYRGDAGPHPSHESRLLYGGQPVVPRDGPRGSSAPETWPVDRRSGSAYYGEYDARLFTHIG